MADSSSKTDDQVVDDMDDVEMMRRPHLWPLGSMLPLKREPAKGGPLETAVLRHPYEADGYEVAEGMTVFGALGEVVHRIYASPEEIAADGWRVD